MRTGADSDTSVGRPLPLEGQRLKEARAEPGFPTPGSATSGECRILNRRETDRPVPVQPAALKYHWYWIYEAGSLLLFRSDRCCSAPVSAGLAAPLQLAKHDHRMASHSHANSEARFNLVRAGLPHSPGQKDPSPMRAWVRCLASPPDPRLQQPLQGGSLFSTGKRTWGGGGSFSLGCFLPGSDSGKFLAPAMQSSGPKS